jgi:hypothetical protein
MSTLGPGPHWGAPFALRAGPSIGSACRVNSFFDPLIHRICLSMPENVVRS